jgi:formate hydrogenlyase subunit 3/multisubunit Na+/H+ antiporter MnhD subunit
MYFKKPEETKDVAVTKEITRKLPLSMAAPMLILASLCIIMGIIWLTEIPQPLINQILLNLRMGVTI